LCQTDGRLDDDKLRTVVSRLVDTKPRDFATILGALQKLTRLEMERRKVTVESAVELDEATRRRVLAGLVKKYGTDLVAVYQVNPALLGGLRIRIGNDVFDGTVQGRLARLAAAF
jgi:F-type H+-transporting ATPase subunit delta